MKRFIAEAIGTMALVFFGCGSAAFVGVEDGGSVLLVALAFGLSLATMAYLIGHISGCHINPAVSLAMLVRKVIDVKDFVSYIIAQFIGAIAGAALLQAIFSFCELDYTGTLGSNSYDTMGIGGAWVAEIILTFFFVLIVLGVTRREDTQQMAGLIAGLSLAMVHIVGIPLTGTSVNPARSFGPALIQAFTGSTESIEQVWVFLLAPLVGALLAALVFPLIEEAKKSGAKK